MALLHKIGQSDSESVYDAYAQKPSEGTIAKYKMPDDSHDPEVITDLILDELLLDGNAKQNLSTFCQTYADPLSPLTTLTIKVLQVRHPKRNPFLRPFWVLSFSPAKTIYGRSRLRR